MPVNLNMKSLSIPLSKKLIRMNSIKIKSPCTDKCKYDENKICIGCYRNMHEIVNWPEFTDEHKLEIIARVDKKIKKNI